MWEIVRSDYPKTFHGILLVMQLPAWCHNIKNNLYSLMPFVQINASERRASSKQPHSTIYPLLIAYWTSQFQKDATFLNFQSYRFSVFNFFCRISNELLIFPVIVWIRLTIYFTFSIYFPLNIGILLAFYWYWNWTSLQLNIKSLGFVEYIVQRLQKTLETNQNLRETL